MNRIIKFRGKRVDNGEWVYGYYLHAHGNSKMLIDRTPSNPEHWVFENISFDSHLICTFIPPDTQGWDYNEHVSFHKVIPETVGQFTGLHDKNGKEIYEGDCTVEGELVVFFDGIFGTTYKGNQQGVSMLSEKRCKYLKITGNIHDND